MPQCLRGSLNSSEAPEHTVRSCHAKRRRPQNPRLSVLLIPSWRRCPAQKCWAPQHLWLMSRLHVSCGSKAEGQPGRARPLNCPMTPPHTAHSLTGTALRGRREKKKKKKHRLTHVIAIKCKEVHGECSQRPHKVSQWWHEPCSKNFKLALTRSQKLTLRDSAVSEWDSC